MPGPWLPDSAAPPSSRGGVAGRGQVGQRGHADFVGFDDDAGNANASLGRGYCDRSDARWLRGDQNPAWLQNPTGPGGVVAADDVKDHILVVD